MMFRHAAQHNIANMVHKGHVLARKQLVLQKNKRLVIIAKEWPQMKLVTRKVMCRLLCIVLMTQRSHKFFRNTEI